MLSLTPKSVEAVEMLAQAVERELAPLSAQLAAHPGSPICVGDDHRDDMCPGPAQREAKC